MFHVMPLSVLLSELLLPVFLKVILKLVMLIVLLMIWKLGGVDSTSTAAQST